MSIPARYLRAFVIGSSYAVFISFFIGAGFIVKNKNYDYAKYTLIAPLYLGMMNMFGLYLSEQFDWSLNKRFLLTGLLSGVVVAIFASVTKAYTFTQEEWLKYYLILISQHVFSFVVIIKLLTAEIETC
uniref:Uncharacterized protein n=1 Tax=Marseillevirus LCMAC201 TaxID=2506605 RepID=A0A481YXZ0_9VIRU|nr:MAG: hypothetical protein LCMAC201_02360 [Marseillevirus LCMAC201]